MSPKKKAEYRGYEYEIKEYKYSKDIVINPETQLSLEQLEEIIQSEFHNVPRADIKIVGLTVTIRANSLPYNKKGESR